MSRPKPEFALASGMSIGARLIWIAVLAMAGIGIQLFFSVLWGWLCLLAAVVMGALRSTSNEPKDVGKREWSNVTIEEVEEAGALLAKTQRWSRKVSGGFSACSCTGCGMLALVLVLVGLVAAGLINMADPQIRSTDVLVTPVAKGGSIASLFVVDALTLLVPLWLFGGVHAWEPPSLRKRIEQLMSIYAIASSDPALEWQPSLQVAKTKGGTVPLDCRMMVKIKESNASFLGMQIQTTINEVQGSSYPYTYCVLIAKPEFGLIGKAKSIIDVPPRGGFETGLLADENEKKERVFPRFEGSLVELDTEGDVEIAVVRQSTRGSGYHTSDEEALEVFRDAYQLALRVLKEPS